MNRPTPIGEAMRRFREERQMSLRQLEAASGITVGVIGNIERGDVRSPSLLPVARLCAAMGITVNDLLIAAGEMQPPEKYRPPVPDVRATRADIADLRAAVERLATRVDSLVVKR